MFKKFCPSRCLQMLPSQHSHINLIKHQYNYSLTSTPCRYFGKPTIEQAKRQPHHLYQLSNEALYLASREEEQHDVHQERLIRDIMAKENIQYDEAEVIMKEMFLANTLPTLYLVPYYTGMAICGLAAVGAAFAEAVEVAYDEIPEPKFANVGSWTWSWMEPLIGTASFSILCFQVFRSQMKKLTLRPYTRSIVKDFGRSQPVRGKKFTKFRRFVNNNSLTVN